MTKPSSGFWGDLMLVATFALVDGPPRRPDRPSRPTRFAAVAATVLGIALTSAGVALTRRR